MHTYARIIHFLNRKLWNIRRLFPINYRKVINSQKQSCFFGSPCTVCCHHKARSQGGCWAV